MKLNATWHKKHKMPKNPTPDQRLLWHIQHAKHCACREMPSSLRRLLRQKTIAGRKGEF